MADTGNEGGGWFSFIVACVLHVVGYTLIDGNPPGVQGVFQWWSILPLFVIWGTVDAAVKKPAG